MIEKHNIAVYSSNYALYGDLSNRVMTLLGNFVEEYEIYSIDESFLSFNGFQNYNLYEYGEKIVRAVRRGTGIPISLGIAETKTLAKVRSQINLLKSILLTGTFVSLIIMINVKRH